MASSFSFQRPTTPGSIAARRGREAPPLTVTKPSPKATFEFDDSLLQVSTPAFPPAFAEPGQPPKIAASPRPPPDSLAPRPTLRQTRSFNNPKPSHKSSFRDLFSRSRQDNSRSTSTESVVPGPVKNSTARPKPPVRDELPSLPAHLKPVLPEPEPFRPAPAQQESNTSSKGGLDLAAALKDTEPTTLPPPKADIDNEWTPPTLPLAYAQAVAHAALEDPDTYRASRVSRNRPATPSARATPSRPSTGYKKPRSSNRRNSDMGDMPFDDATTEDGIPRKMYVLASAGYVLEYAGSGPRDRLPERTLKLCAMSAAFASDAIPGKHWVLHIVQNTNDTSADKPLAPKKSFVQRILKTNTAPRKVSARRLLLIFDSPAALNQWIVAVRNEVSRHGGKVPRPPTAIKKPSDEASVEADANADSKSELTVTPPELPREKESLQIKPPSPTAARPPAPAVSSPPTLPNSPTTLVGSERLSRADTAVGSNMSSSRSSRAVGKMAVEMPKTMASPIPERRSVEYDAAHAEPPSTDEDRDLESATTHSHASLSFDSSAGASHTSTEKTTPMDGEGSDVGSSFSSPSQTFFTPLTTPVTWTFPRDQKRVSTYATAIGSPAAATGEEPSVQSPGARNAALRQSQSAPRLAATSPMAMETIRESSGAYFNRRSPAPVAEEAEEPPRSPMGNAFAEAAERDERSHSRVASSTGNTQSTASSARTSTAPARSSPRGTPHGSQPGSKRGSIIHSSGPLPLRTSQTLDTLSVRATQDGDGPLSLDLRNVHTRGESDSRESALLQLSGEGPESASPSASPQARLRRPSSLRVKTDMSPGAARTVQSPPRGAMSTPTTATDKTAGGSTLVPIVRPPSVRPQARGLRGSRSLRLGASNATAPPSAPPTVPLPPPPGRQMPPMNKHHGNRKAL